MPKKWCTTCNFWREIPHSHPAPSSDGPLFADPPQLTALDSIGERWRNARQYSIKPNQPLLLGADIPARSTRYVTVEPQITTKPRRFVVGADCADAIAIHGFTIAGLPQMSGYTGMWVSGRCFPVEPPKDDPDPLVRRVDNAAGWHIIPCACQFAVEVENLTSAPIHFSAILYGDCLC